ncbi:MAG: GxxExxY protein [Bacteroidaceae bacterium]|nr:GxxExxY protein [Bacteroidaceae bacterium]
MDLLFKEEAYKIVGAAMAVHRHFGCGFSEKVYQDALEIEFQEQNIPFLREEPIFATYHNQKLKTEFIPDFICFGSIIVELKAVQELEDYQRSQAINYAKVANMSIALLINFGEPSLRYERYIV